MLNGVVLCSDVIVALCIGWVPDIELDGPLTRYAKLQVAHAPGIPGTFFPPPQVSDSRYASRHVRDACAVMHAGIIN